MKVLCDKKQIMKWDLTFGSSFWCSFPLWDESELITKGKDTKMIILPPKSGTLRMDLKLLDLSIAGTFLLIN